MRITNANSKRGVHRLETVIVFLFGHGNGQVSFSPSTSRTRMNAGATLNAFDDDARDRRADDEDVAGSLAALRPFLVGSDKN